jgi:hypothetical protein
VVRCGEGRVVFLPQADVRLTTQTLTQAADATHRVIREQTGIMTHVVVGTRRAAGAISGDAVRVHIVNPVNQSSIQRILDSFGVAPDRPAKKETARAQIKADLATGIGVTLADERLAQRSLIIVPDSPLGIRGSNLAPDVMSRCVAILILHELSEAGGGEPEQAGPHRLVVDSKGTLPRLNAAEKAALRRALVPVQGKQQSR